ncbi:MAG: hypothetical protein OEM98_05145 [Gammaproteobacteria bacterium]|nr:hypothetical protein [Gammaproteobacteria bacterium]
MMEIWIRSIARAGGVEMPASARVLEPQSRRPPSLRPALARGLKSLGGYLLRAGDQVCGEANAAIGRC